MNVLKCLLVMFAALVFAACGGETPDRKSDTGSATTGVDGTDGTDGADGSDGTDGADGSDGTGPIDGTDGTDGTDGIDGKDGTDGMSGGPKPPACVDDADCQSKCPDGKTCKCVNKKCVLEGSGSNNNSLAPCTDDSDCESEKNCPKTNKNGCKCADHPKADGKACVPACNTAADCPKLAITLDCVEGVCKPKQDDNNKPKCATDDDCKNCPSEKGCQCVDGVCKVKGAGTGAPKCTEDKDCQEKCPAGKVCVCQDSKCVTKSDSGPSTLPTCEKDEDCTEKCPKSAKIGCACNKKTKKCGVKCSAEAPCPNDKQQCNEKSGQCGPKKSPGGMN